MWLVRKPLHQRRPVLNPVVGDSLQADMGSRTEQPLLQVLAKSVIDCQSYDKRRNPGGDSRDRNPGDDSDKRLTALSAKISGCDEKFEAHEAFSCQLSAF